MSDENETDIERLPDEDDEVFGRVTSMLGANRLLVVCSDGEERTCRIPGRMRKKEWIREDDLVVVEPWSWQDEKGDVVHRYTNKEAGEIEDSSLIGDFGA